MRSYVATALLAIVGVVIMGIGTYFAILRPALLPEDLRFIGADVAALAAVAPGITSWLRFVFMVLGAYAFTTGLLTFHFAFTAFRSGCKIPVPLIAFTGLTSVGVMALVNFAIRSDFRWLLAGLGALWAMSVILQLPFGSSPRSGDHGGA